MYVCRRPQSACGGQRTSCCARFWLFLAKAITALYFVSTIWFQATWPRNFYHSFLSPPLFLSVLGLQMNATTSGFYISSRDQTQCQQACATQVYFHWMSKLPIGWDCQCNLSLYSVLGLHFPATTPEPMIRKPICDIIMIAPDLSSCTQTKLALLRMSQYFPLLSWAISSHSQLVIVHFC